VGAAGAAFFVAIFLSGFLDNLAEDILAFSVTAVGPPTKRSEHHRVALVTRNSSSSSPSTILLLIRLSFLLVDIFQPNPLRRPSLLTAPA
jgi:hypothetical protein